MLTGNTGDSHTPQTQGGHLKAVLVTHLLSSCLTLCCELLQLLMQLEAAGAGLGCGLMQIRDERCDGQHGGRNNSRTGFVKQEATCEDGLLWVCPAIAGLAKEQALAKPGKQASI